MKDEIYPPPRPAPRFTSDYNHGKKPGKNRKLYMIVSIVFMLFAIALNFSNNTNLISLKAGTNALPKGVSEVAARLQNFSAMTVYASRIYTLETLDGENWREIASNEHLVEATHFTVRRFDHIDLTFGRFGVFEPLQPGKYRLKLDIIAQSALIGPTHSKTLYAEFTVKD